eukprot:4695256-Prymnesium_polylepis.1
MCNRFAPTPSPGACDSAAVPSENVPTGDLVAAVSAPGAHFAQTARRGSTTTGCALSTSGCDPDYIWRPTG